MHLISWICPCGSETPIIPIRLLHWLSSYYFSFLSFPFCEIFVMIFLAFCYSCSLLDLFVGILFHLVFLFCNNCMVGDAFASWLAFGFVCWLSDLYTKVGICNLSPHLRNSAILQTTKSIAELWTKKVTELQLRTFKIWLPQFRKCPQSPAVPLLSRHFSSAQDGLKKNILELFVSMKTKSWLKGTVAWDFLPPIFFSWIFRIPTSKICENFLSEATELKLWTSEKIAIAELRLRLRSNISEKVAEVLPSSCGIAITDSNKSCACPLLSIYIYSVWLSATVYHEQSSHFPKMTWNNYPGKYKEYLHYIKLVLHRTGNYFCAHLNT